MTGTPLGLCRKTPLKNHDRSRHSELSRSHTQTPDMHGSSGLFQWLNATEVQARNLQLELDAIGGTFDAIIDRGYFKDYANFRRSLNSFEGGLMRLVSHIAGSIRQGDELDGIIYLLDPVDPSSTFPEAR
jgi:methylglyoxal synthase